MSAVLNVSPFSVNVLDLVDVQLIAADGRRVVVRRPLADFVIWIASAADGSPPDREDFRTGDNLAASHRLNMLEVSRYAGRS